MLGNLTEHAHFLKVLGFLFVGHHPQRDKKKLANREHEFEKFQIYYHLFR